MYIGDRGLDQKRLDKIHPEAASKTSRLSWELMGPPALQYLHRVGSQPLAINELGLAAVQGSLLHLQGKGDAQPDFMKARRDSKK